MKNNLLILAFVLCFISGFSQTTGTFKDARDGKVYKTVTIGTQTILAQNFAFKPKQGVYWAYDNNAANVKKYGYLYDWETAKKLHLLVGIYRI
ncbi:MAG: hypothetical protein IAF38_17825 [Bacteroidia bacterium]|nr:hypothetical protein [Bacteroidia bacterium]